MSWAALGSVWIKAASFGSQVVLGYVLSEDDWGIYAIAISVAMFLTALRNGGVREILVQRGADRYDEVAGPVFWMALASNLAISVLLCVLALGAANFYDTPELRNLIWLIALALALETPAQFLRAKLRVELRFGAYVKLDMASATLRYGAMITFALLGFGAVSFVLPLPLVALVEWAVLTQLTREFPFRFAPQFRKWRALLHEVKWLLLGTATSVLATVGDYALLGRFLPVAVVGTYYFAFQFATHASMLGAANVHSVLMPSLVRLGDSPKRHGAAVVRAIRSLSLVTAPVGLSLAVVAGPLERLIWGGEWSHAVDAIRVFSVMLPIRLSFMIATASLKARGCFKRWAVLALVQGGGLTLAALTVGILRLETTQLAIAISCYWLVVSPVVLIVAVGDLIKPMAVLAALLPAWLIACAAAALMTVVDSQLLTGFVSLPRIAIGGLGHASLFLILARMLIPGHLADTLSVLPRPIGRPLAKLLVLQGSSAKPDANDANNRP